MKYSYHDTCNNT